MLPLVQVGIGGLYSSFHSFRSSISVACLSEMSILLKVNLAGNTHLHIALNLGLNDEYASKSSLNGAVLFHSWKVLVQVARDGPQRHLTFCTALVRHVWVDCDHIEEGPTGKGRSESIETRENSSTHFLQGYATKRRSSFLKMFIVAGLSSTSHRVSGSFIRRSVGTRKRNADCPVSWAGTASPTTYCETTDCAILAT